MVMSRQNNKPGILVDLNIIFSIKLIYKALPGFRVN